MNKKLLKPKIYPFTVPKRSFGGRGNLQPNSGFSLVEVMVSMFILTVGILSILSLISDTLKNVDVTKNSVIAANLAQEGIEVVRGLRDANWINNRAYNDNLDIDGSYCVNYNSTALINPCPDFNMYWDSTNKVFAHSGNTLTPFQRTINIDTTQTDSDAVNYLQIQSIVTWEGRTIIAEEHLYDWR